MNNFFNWITNVEFTIAIIGTLTAVITVSLTNYFSKQNLLKLEERKLKEEYYISYIKAISDSVVTDHSENSKNNLADSQNKLLLVASDDVVCKLMIFHDYIKQSNKTFSAEKHDILLTDLIKSMRKDLFANKKVNTLYPIIHLTGKASRDKNTTN